MIYRGESHLFNLRWFHSEGMNFIFLRFIEVQTTLYRVQSERLNVDYNWINLEIEFIAYIYIHFNQNFDGQFFI